MCQRTERKPARSWRSSAIGRTSGFEIKVSTRNVQPYRDAAIILIDQLKEIYINGELEVVDTVQWFPKIMRGDYTVGLNLTGNGLDVESPGGIPPPGAPRTVHDPLESHGSRCSAVAMNESAVGTFETCQRTLKRSAYDGKPEVIGTRSERRE